jgi:hypothetical protein
MKIVSGQWHNVYISTTQFHPLYNVTLPLINHRVSSNARMYQYYVTFPLRIAFPALIYFIHKF